MRRTRFARHITARQALCLVVLALGVSFVSWALVGIAQPMDSLFGYPGAPSASQFNVSSATLSSFKLGTLALQSPQVGAKLGVLYIPKLAKRFPIVEGTTAQELRRGVGHFRGSVMPGGPENCVLSGHRDTVFGNLGRLKKGNRLIVTTAAGTFTYKVRLTRIVKANDKTVVVRTGRAVLTVTTCYPFNYVGSAPKRFVVVADLVSSKK